jgi:carbonic anhydrase
VHRIQDGVRRFRTEIFPANRALYEELAEKQKPDALFLTCGDSRIDPSLLTDSAPGEIFVERTPGNIVPVYDDADRVGVSASIEYSVAVLGVRDIIVCGHSTCGAMKGFAPFGDSGRDSRYCTMADLRRSGSGEVGPGSRGLAESERLEILSRLNVVEQMAHLHTHPAVEERFKNGTLGIHGWYYEIHTGRVEAYDAASGTFKLWPE